MHNLFLCSFVGVDTNTDIDVIRKLEEVSPIALEWGVLYSPGRAGRQNRYPSFSFIKDFLHERDDFEKSLHLCGEAVDQYLNNSNPEISTLIERSGCRTQLNFAIDKYDESFLLDKVVELHEKHCLILQCNKSKKKFIDKLIKLIPEENKGNVNILYDGSGGFGRVISKAEAPFPGFFTGYAGGINPTNVTEIVEMIDKVVADAPYYIDMESGIRTDDWLDLDKCKAVIKSIDILQEKYENEDSI